jgi:hypothetical protein
MLAEFVLPKALIVACVIFPVCLHILQSTRILLLKDRSDIGVCSGIITILFIGSIAIIGPTKVVSRMFKK